MGANDTLDLLLGTWRVERTVHDRRGGADSQFFGTATFTRRADEPRADVVCFEEVGDYAVGAYRGEARRSLEYVASDDSTVAIAFRDGRHFIDLDLARGVSRDEHLCNSDRYEITTILKHRDLIEERWRVRGPEKDYVAVALLTRVTDRD